MILARMRAEPREWRVNDLAAAMGVSALTLLDLPPKSGPRELSDLL